MQDKRVLRRTVMTVMASALGAGATASAFAQPAGTWPNRPLRILVPYAAGGSTDILTRLLAQQLSEELRQSVVVENKGGAGGNLGVTSFVASSFDDHYFLMVSQSQISINQFLFKSSLGYDPVADLVPVGLVAQTANVIVVPPSLPVTTFKGLIDYCKARPGKVAYSSAGVGSTGHLLNELLKTTTGIDIVHVPYKGNGPAMQAVLAGDVQFNTDNMPQLLQQIKGERLRPLAVTSAQRWPQLPEVPTVAELGYPSLTTAVWFGLVAQSRMPRQTVDRMNAAINKVLTQPGFEAKLRENSLEATPGTPEKMAQQAESERRRWSAVVEASGATAE
ncbi:Bug family tripartite tricarboxylate transporter substrate binding protein [Roseomonas chloroacetimidivorans]|uniref:Bug family tripartite tricarboxylate transporter substrate binding protein n=1 Tax=Roseomonas chloroacetimidivorans TaxID=1766656 RepID=UPI003C780E1F